VDRLAHFPCRLPKNKKKNKKKHKKKSYESKMKETFREAGKRKREGALEESLIGITLTQGHGLLSIGNER
jgi:hypothetical protein